MFLSERMKKTIAIWFIVGFVILAFVLPMYFFSNWNISDILLLPGVLCLAYLGLALIVRAGTFDTFRYQTVNWVNTTFRKGTPKRYEDAYEYKQAKEEKRKENKIIFWPWLVYGVVCLVLCVIFALVLTK